MYTKTYETINTEGLIKVTDYEIVSIEKNFIIVKNNKGYFGTLSLESKTGKGCILLPIKYQSVEKIGPDMYRLLNDKDMYCLMNNKGNIVSETDYDYIDKHDDFYLTKRNNHFGLLNKEGQVIFDTIYSNINHFENGVAIVRDEYDNYGLISDTGKEIISPRFGRIDVNGGIIKCRDDVTYNYLYEAFDMDGNSLIDFKCNYFHNINDKYLTFYDRKEKIIGIFNCQNKKIMKSWKKKKTKDYLLFCVGDNKFLKFYNNKLKIIDANGKKIASLSTNQYPKEWDFNYLGENHFKLLDNIYTSDGILVSENAYDSIYEYHNGYAIFQKNKRYGIINDDGKEIFDQAFRIDNLGNNRYLRHSFGGYTLHDFSNNSMTDYYSKMFIIKQDDQNILAQVFNKGKWQLLNFGDHKIDLSDYYDDIEHIGDYFKVRINNMSTILDLEGKEISKSKYTDFQLRVENNFFILKHSDSLYSLLNMDGEEVFAYKAINSVHVLNEEQLLINNYLINMSDLKKSFVLEVNINDNKIVKEFESEETRNKALNSIDSILNEQVDNLINNNQDTKHSIKEQNDLLNSMSKDLNDEINHNIIDEIKENNNMIDSILKRNNKKLKYLKKVLKDEH